MSQPSSSETVERLRKAAREVLHPLSPRSRAVRLAVWCRRWLDRHLPWRLEAETTMPAATGFSRPMIHRALDDTFGPLATENLEELAGIRPGPDLTLIVSAGSIPDPLVRSILRTLLGGSAVLVKSGHRDPILPALLARSLHEIDPDLARCLEVDSWKGGDRSIENPLLARVDRVIAYGSDPTVADLQRRCPPGVEFLGHGHRLSLAVIGVEALASPEELATVGGELALDTALYDQSGCLSPHAVYLVGGGLDRATRLGASIAAGLERLALDLPRGPIDPGTATAILEARSRYELRGDPLFTGPGTSWTVAVEKEPTFLPSPLGRFLRVHPVVDLDTVRAQVATLPLQAIAVAPPATGEEIHRSGVRFCPPGQLQRPGLKWLER